MILFLLILATRAHGLLSRGLQALCCRSGDLWNWVSSNPAHNSVSLGQISKQKVLSPSHRSKCPWKDFRGGYLHSHLNSGLRHTLILELFCSSSIQLNINTSFLCSIYVQHCSMCAFQSHCYPIPSRVSDILSLWPLLLGHSDISIYSEGNPLSFCVRYL